ncbi:alpha/beta hydrolase family esterase [Hydrocarboniphaga effusa]|uniref:extracellular catalytic domain type 1 short-chain-length polyhydroxyalkanoate depolymerase n=1 Tax=Hydrocarboniphaga effusa TaxID=243629 RepID=UPI003BAAEC1B
MPPQVRSKRWSKGFISHCVGVCMLALGLPAGAADRDLQTLMHDGLERHYLVRAPQAMPGPTPLVLVLHGGGGDARNAEQMTGFTAKAREQGFIVAYPEGSSRMGKLHTWNAGHCCGYALKKNIDDVGFIRALIDTLSARYPVDARRIYVTGMSNGGMMTHRLGIALGDRIAAIAPVVATVFGDEPQARAPVSALIINGALDDNVPPAGGKPGGRGARAWDDDIQTRPALDQAAFWGKANACAEPPAQTDIGTALRWDYRCPPGRDVGLYLVKDNGHAWPGGQAGSRRGDTPSTHFDATDVIWKFFAAHPK